MKLLILFAPFMLYPSNLSQLRLVFPTLQRNESPFTLLGQWLATLGRKIDTAADVQDYMALRLGKFGMLPNLKNLPYILLNQLTPSTLVGEVGIQGWYSSKWVAGLTYAYHLYIYIVFNKLSIINWSSCRPRLSDQMVKVLKSMNTSYDALTTKQAEFMMLDGEKAGSGL